MADQGGAADPLLDLLLSAGAEVLRLENPLPTGDVKRRIRDWAAAGPVQGIYWLPALDDEGPLESMDLGTWRDALRSRVKLLHEAMTERATQHR